MANLLPDLNFSQLVLKNLKEGSNVKFLKVIGDIRVIINKEVLFDLVVKEPEVRLPLPKNPNNGDHIYLLQVTHPAYYPYEVQCPVRKGYNEIHIIQRKKPELGTKDFSKVRGRISAASMAEKIKAFKQDYTAYIPESAEEIAKTDPDKLFKIMQEATKQKEQPKKKKRMLDL